MLVKIRVFVITLLYTVLNYLFATYCLSAVGVALYWLMLRRAMPLAARKYTLLGITIFSLVLPWAIDSLYVSRGANPCLHEHPIPEVVYTEYCPTAGEEMLMCYEIATTTAHFCSCKVPSIENLLVFRANPYYDFLLYFRPMAYGAALFIGLGLVALLLLKLAYLGYLIATARQELMTVGQYSCTILYPQKPMSVGSFRLWKGYIVWQPEMFDLPDEEKKAIIWHEVSHLQQYDTWWKIGLYLLHPMWVFNPFFYLLKSEIEQLSEYIADEFAVRQTGSRKKYAHLLLKMKGHSTIAALPLAHQFSGASRLQQRVQSLAVLAKPSPNRPIAYLGLLFIVITLWLTADYSLSAISAQYDDLKVYETMLFEKQTSGNDVFCKSCLFQKYR